MLAISFAQGKGLSPVQLQKALFLLGKQFPSAVGEEFYNFVAYNYGPFDKSIYWDTEELAQQGYVSVSESGPGLRKFAPTPEGALCNRGCRRRTKAIPRNSAHRPCASDPHSI